MKTRRAAMAGIVSCITGIPIERLEEFDPLKRLLLKAEKADPGEEHFYFGIFTFIWPVDDHPFVLGVSVSWSPGAHKMRSLEDRYWPNCDRQRDVFAHFSLRDEGAEADDKEVVYLGARN